MPLVNEWRKSWGTYSSSGLEAGHIQSGTSRDSDVLEDDAGTAGLALDSAGGIGEGAASTLLKDGSGLGRKCEEPEGGSNRSNHFYL